MLTVVTERGFECKLDGEVIASTDNTSNTLLVDEEFNNLPRALTPYSKSLCRNI